MPQTSWVKKGSDQFMAKKKSTALKQKKTDNAAVYKVMVALFLLCFGLVALRSLRKYYSTVAGVNFFVGSSILTVVGACSLALCLISVALFFLIKKRASRAITPWFIFLFTISGYTAVSMKLEYTEGFYTIYFLWAVVLVQYMIYQLYRWEFFLFSLPTICTGFLFFQTRNGYTPTMRCIVPLVLAIVSLLCTALIAVLTAKNKGCLVFGEKRLRVFSKRYEPFLHYTVVVLWVICLVASFILGSLFAFYCMFAAIAVEFIAAVYYTFQLN